MQTAAFLEYLEREKQDILDHCTQCGTCVEVCPMPQYDPAIAQTDPVLVVGKVLELLRTGVASPEAKAWALSCSNSGRCIPACPEGVNPRKMLALARLELRRQQTASNPQAAQQAARDDFKALGGALRLLLSVQLRPEDIQRLLPGAISERQRPADVVFYFGCNILRTPEIALTVLDVLDRLEVDYEVLGGTGNCCITFMRAGEPTIAQAQAAQTLSNMAAFTPQEVLTWCPSCNVHMQDFVLEPETPDFPMRHVTGYLVAHLPELQQHFVQPVRKRVALHEHHGVDGVAEDVRHLLSAIPGLELVTIPQLTSTVRCWIRLPPLGSMSWPTFIIVATASWWLQSGTIRLRSRISSAWSVRPWASRGRTSTSAWCCIAIWSACWPKRPRTSSRITLIPASCS